MAPGSTDSHLNVDPRDPLDLTGVLKSIRIVATGPLSVVYRCLYEERMKVAAKVITFPANFDPNEKEEFLRKVKCGLRIWRTLKHSNIVPFLGTANGSDFGSDLPCIVSTWMAHGTLFEYVEQTGTKLSLLDRIRLIKGSVAGVEYLHSQGILHGDLYPANIVIDDGHNARLTNLGSSQTLYPVPEESFSCIYTLSIPPGPALWSAPELLYPGLYSNPKFRATLRSDIYSLASIMLFILSGKYPWRDRGEAENRLKEFHNPPRPVWPVNIPDGVWDFIERCWSPREPGNRPSAQEVLSFSTDRLEQLLRPSPTSVINVVLFGALGSGKSSVINLLAGKEIAQTSSGAEPCTERPTSYHISVNKNRFRLWDTMGFFPAHDGSSSHLSPYEQAYAVLRNLPQGVNLILLCAHKGMITPSLGNLYWYINHFFHDGRAPIAFVATHLDTPDEEWWERNKHSIAGRTGIPMQSIPHACVTTDPAGCDQSKRALKELLQTYATTVTPIPLRYDLSSYTAISSDLTTRCRLSQSEARSLVEKLRRPLRPFNVVFCGETNDLIINLITGHPGVESNTGAITYARSHVVSTGMQQFHIWDPMIVNGVRVDGDSYVGGLENACQLIRDLSGEGGVDLLVFCKRHGRLTAEELSGYRLIEELLCKRKSPVAVIVTHVESPYPAEKWWAINGKDLVKTLGGKVIGHSCIPPLASYDSHGANLNKTQVNYRLSVEAMLEECVRSRRTWFSKDTILSKLIARRYVSCEKKVTVEALMNQYGFTREQAERLIQSHNG